MKNRPFLLLSTAFFLLVVIYAAAHTWEYDEGWTYLSVKHESFLDLVTYRHFNIANNHLLNSLWFRLMETLGCRNVLFYRLLSIACFPFFAFFLYKWATYGTSGWTTRSDWYLTLFFLPPMIVYFAGGRGYAMATTAFLGAFYYLKVYLAEKNTGDYWKFFLLGVISCLSIVSFLFPFVAMLLYCLIKAGDGLFSKKNIITALFFLPLFLYIYYVGKTILLNDKIINGTDNLFVYGMYSTFVSALSIYPLVFPSQDLFVRLHIDLLSKVLVLLTFVPVAWLFIRKYRIAFPELIVLVITTALFFGSHILLKSKYPSDRSVIFILYLLYIPLVQGIVRYGETYLKPHYFTLFLFGTINLCGFFYVLTKPDFYHVMSDKPTKDYTIFSDWPNWGDDVNNELYFNGRLHFHYMAVSFEKELDKVDQRIKEAAVDPQVDYILLQQSSYQRNKQLFEKGYEVRMVMSSGVKECYLIQKKG